jgi:enoyl-[acyl-carrier protein] reductase II
MLKTRVTELFGIDYPIIAGGMVWMSTAKLVAAVSNAGGLGLIAGGSCSADQLVQQIDRCRELTDKPFGVNIPLIWPPATELMNVVIEKKVPIVFTSAGSPKRFTPMLKEHGVKVAHVVPSSALAAKCEAAGVDAVVAEGSEGGGHIAKDEVSTMVLTPLARKAVSIPLIAAGGIATGAQMAAAFCLGAEGVQIGTRFICTEECEGHPAFKQAIIDADETGTTVTLRKLLPVRNIKNELTAKIYEMEDQGKPMEEVLEFIGFGRSERASLEGDVAWGTVQAGQVSGLVEANIPVETLIARILQEAKAACENVAALR